MLTSSLQTLAGCLALAGISAAAAPNEPADTHLAFNPGMLSGGVFSALDAAGEFGPPLVSPTRAGNPDIAKGRARVVLDARIGANIRVGDDPSSLPANQRGQAEPHVARSAANPDLLLATFQEGRFADSGSLSCGYAVSRDGGLSWSRALIPTLTTTSGGRLNRATDPVAAVGPQGDLYLQTLGSVEGTFSIAAVALSRSIDGGTTWSAPITIFEPTNALTMPDKNWLTVNDYPAAPRTGRLVATWTRFQRNAAGTTLANPVVASLSDDRGLTWSTPVEITPPTSANQGTQPLFLPDGSLLVIYSTFLDPNDVRRFSLHCKRSLDGGVTFPAVATTLVDPVAGWDDPDVRDGVFLASAAVARTTGEVFVAYTAVVDGTPRVMVSKSIDRGTSWSAPIAVSDQPFGVSVMNPTVVVMPDGLAVSVVFMDKRHAPDGRSAVDHFVAQSFDGGATWQPNLRLTESSSELRFGPMTSRGVMLGDYLGVAPALTADQACVAVWCDTRTGDADVYSARFAPRAAGDFSAWSIAHLPRMQASAADAALADLDRDGFANIAEFALGNDPLAAESGEAVVVRRPRPGTLDVLWQERATLGPYALSAVVRTGANDGPLRAGTAVPAAELPTPTTPGLTWRGERFAIAADQSEFVALGFARPTTSELISIRDPVTPFTATNTSTRLINLSTRAATAAGDTALIVGFVLDGPKQILLRAAGPALTALGVRGALADPHITLAAPASDLLRTNDDWDSNVVDSALFTRLGAFPFARNSRDAALALPLGPQSYTAAVGGSTPAPGLALVEVYDADPNPGDPANPRLLNVSTRGEVGAGDGVLIAGFVIKGSEPRRLLVRAIGPTLASFGVRNALPDPVLAVYQGERLVAANDDWGTTRSADAVALTGRAVGAFSLPSGTRDAALLLTLTPGAYTAVITSADGTPGVALVEVYDVD